MLAAVAAPTLLAQATQPMAMTVGNVSVIDLAFTQVVKGKFFDHMTGRFLYSHGYRFLVRSIDAEKGTMSVDWARTFEQDRETRITGFVPEFDPESFQLGGAFLIDIK